MQSQRITVLGAGTMGHGIAHVAAQAGYLTTLYDLEPHLVDAGIARIAANLDKGIARNKLDAATKAEVLQAIKGHILARTKLMGTYRR